MLPPDTSHQNIFADLPGNERQGKEGKWRGKEGKWRGKEGKSKKGRWKIENGRRKRYKMRKGPFFLSFIFSFFFFFSLFKTT